MITIDDKPKYAIVTMLQDAIAGAFASNVPLAKINAAPGTSLSHELRTGQTLPRNLAVDFTPLLDLLHLPLLGGGGLGLDPLSSVLGLIADPLGELKRIFEGAEPSAMLSRAMDFFTKKPELTTIASTLGAFLEGQFAIALSLITTFKNLLNPSLPRAVADGCLQYFFSKSGFTTVDKIQIIPPMQFSGAPQQLSDLNSFLSKKSGERYLRDLTSIVVEAAGDVQYQLRDRYPKLLAQLPSTEQETATSWFTGFASMAEAGVTSAVEETLTGIGSFQGNALITSAAATYAGTAARKATQHVFLSEMGL